MGTGIPWCDETWNPLTGCTRVSDGCKNCWAFELHDRRHRAYLDGKKLAPQYAQPFSEVQMLEERLEQPSRWRKPRRIFVNSMSDLFHPAVHDLFRSDVFGVMDATPRHTYIILTKRPQEMLDWFNRIKHPREVGAVQKWSMGIDQKTEVWPLPNVILGISAENQKTLDARTPLLFQTPAAARAISLEPLLGPVDCTGALLLEPPLDWLIVGGESGPKARPMHPDWPLAVAAQCRAAGVPFFCKQSGAWRPKSWGARATNGRRWGTLTTAGAWFESTTPWNGQTLDDSTEREEVMVRYGNSGADPSEWPKDLRVQQFPEVKA